MTKLMTKKGFTLVEMLIYIAILTFVSVAITRTLLVASRSWVGISANRNITVSAQSAYEVMTREIRNATSIDQVQSTFGSNPGVLMLNSTDTAGNAQTVKFFVQNGILNIQRGSNSAFPITLSTASTSVFRVYRISTSQSEAVKVELTASSTIRNVTRTQDFSGTVILRGTYTN